MPPHNTNVLPSWLTKTIVSVLVAALITGAIAWASNQTSQLNDNANKVAVLQTKAEATSTSIEEIKASQRRMEDKLDRILEGGRESSRSSYRYYK